jgi:ribosome-associated protein
VYYRLFRHGVVEVACRSLSRVRPASPHVVVITLTERDGCDAAWVAGDLQIDDRLTIPADELLWRFSRSSGPGGQGVNTTDSRVELSWNLSESTALPASLRERAAHRLAARLVGGILTVSASESRSQLRNREAALLRMASLVRRAIAPPPPPRRPTRPTAGAVERRIAEKKRRGRLKRNRSEGRRSAGTGEGA